MCNVTWTDMVEQRPLADMLGRWGRTPLPGTPWMRTTFLLLLILAAVLRSWRLWEMPFMHDELSALSRLYPTLWETIRTGVMEQDTHPPGVQIFEWLWTGLFGTSAFAVKLPFVLMGLCALWLVYRTALAWADAPVALLTVTLLAVLQYSVLYGQLARPYAAGLFTTALCADQLTRWLAFNDRKYLVGMGAGIVLSAYTHHFALLLVGIMASTAYVLVPPGQRRPYLAMWLVCVLLYMPNLPIFWHQLGHGGLGSWLAAPGRHWVSDHLWWVVHTSWILGGALLALLLWAGIRTARNRPAVWARAWLFLAWGLLPMAVGLGYSVWRAPVIQHSVLLYSFPYMCIGLFYGLRGLGRQTTLIMVGVVAVCGVITLVCVRQHYHVAYTNNYRTMIAVARQQLASAPVGTSVWLDAQDEQLDFLLQHGPQAGPLTHFRLRPLQGAPARIDSLLGTTRSPRLVYGEGNGASHEQLARIQCDYSHTVQQIDLPEGRVLVLEREAVTKVTGQPGPHPIATASPQARSGGAWQIAEELAAPHGVWEMTGREYGALCEVMLDTVTTMPQDQVEVIARVQAPEGSDVGLVVELVQNGRTVFYRTDELTRQLRSKADGWMTLIVATRPEHVDHRKGGILLRAYLHNRSHGALLIKDMRLHLRPGNPVLYGITAPIPARWTNRPETGTGRMDGARSVH